MQTSIDGIFACGNVLHVHDLVDFVTKEAYRAGMYAARFAKGEHTKASDYLLTKGKDGVRYVMPQKISRNGELSSETSLFFRVGENFHDKYVVVSVDGNAVIKQKKRRLEPGQMERIALNDAAIAAIRRGKEITVSLKDAEGGV